MMGKKLPARFVLTGMLLVPAAAAATPLDIPEANVLGVGCVPMETDYLPHVVACEHFGADFEALKAQAVAARTYAYYQLLTTGSINDGQSDQVYTCGNPVLQVHIDAVNATQCEVLTYTGTLADDAISAFYVAGAYTTYTESEPFLIPGSDPTNTEYWVTYNYGLTGSDITQTPLGFTTPDPLDFPDNRGCMSQNGSDTLSLNGWTYVEILQFYYGADIGIEVVTDCGNGPPLEACIPPDCNSNGIGDPDDIAFGTSSDCNSNEVPDECELEGNDCNSNGIPDECEFQQIVIWSDDFDTDTAADWTVVNANAQNVATFNFDYSTEGLPPAPHSVGGTTYGLKMVANTAALPPASTGLCAYPDAQSFSGNFTLAWDMYLSWNSGGSTEHMCVGINHGGTKVNGSAAVTTDTDGIFFAADGDGDVAQGGSSTSGEIRDYNSYYGNEGAAATRNPLTYWDHAQAFFQALFPVVAGDPVGLSKAGTPGRQWVVGEINQQNGVITWKLNGAVISQEVNTSDFDSGAIMLGYFDHFISQSTSGDNFIIYDNVRVTVSADDCNTNGILDECDINHGTSRDCNGNGTPDDCEEMVDGDFDGDGDTDLEDFEAFRDCLAGPDAAPNPTVPECADACLQAFDADDDGDTDLADFAEFMVFFSG